MTLPKDDQFCSNCLYFCPPILPGETEGECRRYPPTVIHVPSYRLISRSGRRYALPETDPQTDLWHHFQPMTDVDSWCGEWAHNPDADSDPEAE